MKKCTGDEISYAIDPCYGNSLQGTLEPDLDDDKVQWQW